MLDKAGIINKYGPNKYREPFFDKFELMRDYDYGYLSKLFGQIH